MSNQATSRRIFIQRSLLSAGAVFLCPVGCDSRGLPSSAASGEEWEPAYLALDHQGELEQRVDELWQLFAACECCPRACGANRLAGDTGVCSSTARLKVASAGPHLGEEAPLVGRHGSGTVFFSNCNLLCCFCQNWQINHRGDGEHISHHDLAEMMLSLQRKGCHNINLVTPTHVVPHILKALRLAIPRGLHLPLVYNTSAYDSLEVIKKLDGVIDIYLPDFKYQSAEMADRYSSNAADYPDVAAAVIREMNRQVGRLQVDERGIARRGLIIRHLVMPHNIAGTDAFVRWVAEELSPGTAVNIMAQYRPEHEATDNPKINRPLTREEWRQALHWAEQAGLTDML